MDQILVHNGLGPRIKWAIMAILTGHHARLYMNRFLSKNFPLQVGTMQGIPFSPFIFLHCVEPFLEYSRQFLCDIKLSLR